MLRSTWMRIARDRRVRDRVLAAPGTDDLVSRFVAGKQAADVVAVSGDLIGKGLEVTIDHLGEDVTDDGQAQMVADGYLEVLQLLNHRGHAAGADVSVKLSALGLGLGREGEQLALSHATTIASLATQLGATMTVDMEDHTTTDATLSIVQSLRQSFPATGMVVQASLRRTEADVREFAVERSRVRLCKGAYQEPSSVAWTNRHEVDLAYVRCLRTLMQSPAHPMVASHDPRMIEIARALAERNGREPGSFEYQMLYGIRPIEQRRLVDIGYRCRVYLPYGTDWYGYFVRRVAEKPAAVSLFARQLVGRR